MSFAFKLVEKSYNFSIQSHSWAENGSFVALCKGQQVLTKETFFALSKASKIFTASSGSTDCLWA